MNCLNSNSTRCSAWYGRVSTPKPALTASLRERCRWPWRLSQGCCVAAGWRRRLPGFGECFTPKSWQVDVWQLDTWLVGKEVLKYPMTPPENVLLECLQGQGGRRCLQTCDILNLKKFRSRNPLFLRHLAVLLLFPHVWRDWSEIASLCKIKFFPNKI